MVKKAHLFNSETARIAGKKSKRKPRDQVIRERLDKYLEGRIKKGDTRDRQEIMIEAAFKEWLKGNRGPMAYLMDRGLGKAPENVKFEDVSKTEIAREKLKKLSTKELKDYIKLRKKMEK